MTFKLIYSIENPRVSKIFVKQAELGRKMYKSYMGKDEMFPLAAFLDPCYLHDL